MLYDHSANSDHSIRFLIVAALFIFSIDSSYTASIGNASKPIIAPTIRLNSGYAIPVVGLGTNRVRSVEDQKAIENAIDTGYRHFDTAFVYGNEVGVGKAIQAKIEQGIVKREDIFVTTKLWATFHEPEQVEKAFKKSLENLNLTYVDLYLMHTPIAFPRISKTTNSTPTSIDDTVLWPTSTDGNTPSLDTDYVDTWKAMEELVNKGLVRSIGVSNFNSQQIDRINSIATIKPAANQVECHPNLNQLKLLKYAKEKNITIIGYSPLGRPFDARLKDIAINDPKVHRLAEKYNKSPAQIVLRFSYQNGVIPIPKSANKERQRNNIDIFDFSLNVDDMEIVKSLNNNQRAITFDSYVHDKNYPFNVEF